jgi:hypothetical protein
MKQDPKEVASQQRYELKYIAEKFGVSIKLVRAIVKEVGKSRRKIYARLREIKSADTLDVRMFGTKKDTGE